METGVGALVLPAVMLSAIVVLMSKDTLFAVVFETVIEFYLILDLLL
jgi:hypothetical protein